MKFTVAAVLAMAGGALCQGVTEAISPTAEAPAECTGTYSGKFEITVTTEQSKRSVSEKRAECGAEGILVMTMEDGMVYDDQGRTGYIASNYQFQFDGPPQAGAIYTAGFSMCPGNILALGDSTTFYRCLSGSFYNLYDRDWAEQCEPVSIVAMNCGSTSQIDDGQVIGTSVVETTIITALSDGQPQVVTTTMGIPMCQIGDGQVQVHSTPCASVTSVPTTSSYVPITEHSDGQINVPPTSSTAPAPPPVTTSTTPLPIPSPPLTSGGSSITPSMISSTPSSSMSTSTSSTSSATTESATTSSTPTPTPGAAVRAAIAPAGALAAGVAALMYL